MIVNDITIRNPSYGFDELILTTMATAATDALRRSSTSIVVADLVKD